MNPQVILFLAGVSLFIGLLIYIILNLRKRTRTFYVTVLISWIFFALVPVLIIYGFLTDNNVTGSIMGFSMGGAIAGFILIFMLGMRFTFQAGERDQKLNHINELEIETERLRHELEHCGEKRSPKIIRTNDKYTYKLKNVKNKKLTLITGDMQNITGIDIWVNSENTNMQMSRYFEGSISGIIRYLGAKKNSVGDVMDDLIANDLGRQVGQHLQVQPATVLVTTSGELERTHSVKRIFHVASVRGEVGVGYRPIVKIENCVTNALKEADKPHIKDSGAKSILFPLMGTGTAKGNVNEIATQLLQAAISYLEKNQNSAIDSVYFLIWKEIELEICQEILNTDAKVSKV